MWSKHIGGSDTISMNLNCILKIAIKNTRKEIAFELEHKKGNFIKILEQRG